MQNPELRKVVQSILNGSYKPPKFAFGSGGDYNPFDDSGGGGNPFSSLGDAASAAWDSFSDAAKGALGPIAGVATTVLNSSQLEKLGEAIDQGKVSLQSPIGEIAKYAEITLGEAQKLASAAGRTVSGASKYAYDYSAKLIKEAVKDAKDPVAALKKLDPRNLWNMAREEAYSVTTRAFEANRFHNGGLVPGFANGGEVPSLLQPGEFVMNRGAVNRLGSDFLGAMNGGSTPATPSYNIEIGEIRIEASAQSLDQTFVRTKLIPAIKDEFKRASNKGELLMNERGVFKT
jgi:hypothetical protein